MPPAKTATGRRFLIQPGYSAVAAKGKQGPSRSVRIAISGLKKARAVSVCEIGCGLLANSPHILQAFPRVILTDRKEQFVRIQEKLEVMSRKYASYVRFVDHMSFGRSQLRLDAAIIINVLHVVPSVREREAILKDTNRNLRKGGLIFIDVPRNEYYYKNLVKTAVRHGDGFVMRRGRIHTFYKNMDFQELIVYAERSGFTLEKRFFVDHRLSLLARKTHSV